MGAIIHRIKPEMQSVRFNANNYEGLELIERELYNALSDSKGVIRDMCTHILSAGGKRIRPLLVLYSGLVYSKTSDKLILAAVAAELIHMASLVHDDIIDNSHTRRSKPSVNGRWGNQFAVLCGDYLFAKAFSILSNNRLMESLDCMVEAIQNMCHGEVLQAGDKFDCEVSTETYYERIAKKTAVFIQKCCESGAATMCSDKAQIKALGDYGLNLGFAFQIIDDILDFCGKPDTIGKPCGEDLSQGDITLPVILLFKDSRYGVMAREAIKENGFTRQTVSDITRMLNESGIIDKSFEVALLHIEKSKQCLLRLPPSQCVENLYNITEMLMLRMN